MRVRAAVTRGWYACCFLFRVGRPLGKTRLLDRNGAVGEGDCGRE